MSPTFGLHCAPHLDAPTLDRLEAAARRTGLPLWQVELLGQDRHTAEAFAVAVASDHSIRFLATVDWGRLEALYQSHRVRLPAALRV